MTKFEFSQLLDPLLTAFEKTMSEKLMNLWFERCSKFSTSEIKAAVEKFLESETRTFPRIGEFRTAALGNGERRTPEGTRSLAPSCSRCLHGVCSVERWIGPRKHFFSFRCICPAGHDYPGLPLVRSDEGTVMDSRLNFAPMETSGTQVLNIRDMAQKSLNTMDGI